MKTNKTRIIALVLIVALSFALSAGPVAAQIPVDDSVLQEINKVLAFIEPHKDIYSLEDVDFSALSVGAPILAYEYVDNGMKLLDFCVYPLIYEDTLVALAAKPDDNASVSITTSLVKIINECVSVYDDFVLLYDSNRGYLYTDNSLTILSETAYTTDSRGNIYKESNGNLANAIIDLSLSQIERTAAQISIGYTGFTADQSRSAFSGGITRASAYMSVPYISQFPPSPSLICWAACTASVGAALTGIVMTAEQAARSRFGNGFNRIGTTNDIEYLLQTYYSLSYYEYSSTPSASTFYSKISAGRPVIARWSVSSGGNHFTVVNGVDTTYLVLNIMDPENGFVGASQSGGQFSFVSLSSGSPTCTLTTYYVA